MVGVLKFKVYAGDTFLGTLHAETIEEACTFVEKQSMYQNNWPIRIMEDEECWYDQEEYEND